MNLRWLNPRPLITYGYILIHKGGINYFNPEKELRIAPETDLHTKVIFMKKLCFNMLLLAIVCAPSFQLRADAVSELVNICTIIKNDDKSELRKKLKRVQKAYRLRLGDYYGAVKCSGNSMIRHALVASANQAGAYLVSQMRRADLRKAEEDGKTVAQWAQDNGHIGSQTGSAILQRIDG